MSDLPPAPPPALSHDSRDDVAREPARRRR